MSFDGVGEIINYPPSFDQARIVGNALQLWGLRIFSLVVLIYSLDRVARQVLINRRAMWIFRFLTYSSGALFILGFSYPWDTLKIVFICILFQIVMKRKILFLPSILLGILVLALFNLYVLKINVPVINDLSLVKSQGEVVERFYKERQMQTEAIPTLIRRLAYNKYSLVFKTGIEDVFRVGDLESLFFQEVHPLSQKSLVLFFYPAFILFILSLKLFASGKIIIQKHFLIFWGIMSIAYFSISDLEAYRKLAVVFILLSIVIAMGTEKLLTTKKTKKYVAILLLTLIGYGSMANLVDWSKRPEYWLDNRPLFYKNIFKMVPIDKHDNIVLADRFGLGNKYCRFYRSDCTKFEFDTSDLKKRPTKQDNLLIGFWGSFENLQELEKKGGEIGTVIADRKIVDKFYLRDNIANGFSTLVIALEKIKIQVP